MQYISIDFIVRLGGAIVLAIGAGILGQQLAHTLEINPDASLAYTIIFGLLGALTGLILTPSLTIHPVRRVRHRLVSLPPESLVAIIIGTFLGLAASAFLSGPLSLLPNIFSHIAPLLVVVVFVYLGITIMLARQHDLWSFFSNFRPLLSNQLTTTTDDTEQNSDVLLLDTSVIIDGRIADISKTGFIRGTLLVPNFVLQELQFVADSEDNIRRNRGRRGLEVLNILQKDAPIPVRITDMDVSEVREVDSKLVALARHLHCPIMTNDYNLNRVAELQGVTVLNLNDLANTVKAAYLPGEDLGIKIIQEGREAGQGVGYLEDGTMVVVENGQKHLNNQINVIVTKTLQTSAGRMIFAQLDEK